MTVSTVMHYSVVLCRDRSQLMIHRLKYSQMSLMEIGTLSGARLRRYGARLIEWYHRICISLLKFESKYGTSLLLKAIFSIV